MIPASDRQSITGGRRLAAAGGVGLVALVIASPVLMAPSAQFDAGIAASGATFTLHGLLPYRDYWLLYGPLAGYVLAPATAIFGPSLALLSLAGFVVLFIQTSIGYLIARTWTYPVAAAAIALVATLMPAALTSVELLAWPLAMTLALAGLYALGRPSVPTWVGGVLIGLAFMTRLDVGGYALLAALLFPARKPMVVGFTAVAGPFALMSLVTTPLADLIEQVVWFPLIGMRSSRAIPGIEVEYGPELAWLIAIPVAVVPRLLIAASGLRLAIRRPVDRRILALTAFALLCQAQTLGRTDVPHFVHASTPALMLLATMVRPNHLRSAAVLGASLAPIVLMIGVGLAAAVVRSEDSRDQDLQGATAVVRQMTAPGEPIYVGLTAHRHTYLNPMAAYYLADRPPGTMMTLFNPGVTNRDDTQTRMVQELIASDTKVLLLDEKFADTFEPENDSRIPGSTILDEFIADRFALACQFGDYHVMVRVDGGDPARACPLP